MKGMKGFIVLVIILFVVMVLAQMQMPKRFEWGTSYSHHDNQPFGCAVFDSIMSATAQKGYTVTDSSLYQINSESNVTSPRSYLVVKDFLEFDENDEYDVDLKAVQKLLSKGHHVVLAVGTIYDIARRRNNYDEPAVEEEDVSEVEEVVVLEAEDTDFVDNNEAPEMVKIDEEKKERPPGPGYQTLGFRYRERSHDYKVRYYFWKWFSDTICDTITWLPGNGYARRNFYFPIAWGENAIELRPGVRAQVLATDKYWYVSRRFNDQYEVIDSTIHKACDTLAVVIPHGRGKLVVTTMPHLFTNYGVLDPEMRELSMRILSQVADRPIVRLDPHYYRYSFTDGGESQSPLRYLLDNAPLRWALYLTLFAVLLFIVFTARRRQRVIPVIKRPTDQAMEMVRHIGTLYYERHDNADLLQKKYQYFTAQLRREAVVDIDDGDHLDTELGALAQLTGIKPDQLRTDVASLQAAVLSERISDDQLKYFINLMNDIIKRL